MTVKKLGGRGGGITSLALTPHAAFTSSKGGMILARGKLSITTTLWGLVPLKGHRFGNRDFSINSSNVSAVTLPSTT